MERKEVKFDSVDVDAAGTLEGYASIFDVVDFQNDVVVPGAFAGSLARFFERGFIGWHHEMTVPVAYPTAAREDSRGLFIAARFHTTADGQRARTIAGERVAAGKNMGLSIGYTVKAGGARRRDDGVRELRELELLEVSLVMLPANELAGVTAVKAQDVAWTRAEHDALREQARIRKARSEGELLRAEHLELRRRFAELDNADYFEVRASAVPLETRSTVAALVEKARGELAIPAVRVRYFRPAGPGEIEDDRALARRLGAGDAPLSETFREQKGLNGLATAWNNEVWIRSDLVGDELAYVVAHEARHIAQGTPAVHSKEARDQDQQDAHAYGERFLKRFGSKSLGADPSSIVATRSVESSPDARVAAQAQINALAPLHNAWRLAMRTSDTYENKGTEPPRDLASEKAEARAALEDARAAYDAAIDRRDAVIAELLPTFGRGTIDHPRVTAARAEIETASNELQDASIRFHRIGRAHHQEVAARDAQAERAAVEEKLALRRARTRPRGVAARIRELLS